MCGVVTFLLGREKEETFVIDWRCLWSFLAHGSFFLWRWVRHVEFDHEGSNLCRERVWCLIVGFVVVCFR
jgi:hypothetical protein